MANEDQLDPMNWALQPRAEGTRAPVFTELGKHYGRTIHQTMPLAFILDEAKICLELQRVNPANLEVAQNRLYQDYYLPIRRRFGRSLDDRILNDVDWSFRNKSAAQFCKGCSQGRSDNLVILKRVIPQHVRFRHLPVDHLRGFSTQEYADMLKTPELDLDDPELRAALNAGISDAPSNRLPAALYANYEFPGPNAHPFQGLFRSNLFVDAYLAVFLGPRAALHLTPGSGGHCSKSHKNKMTKVTKASIAYIAMLLR
ncbi:hypothetical protein FRC07_004205, partial [Ceratobasidium sp. 392]